ncbi:MAG: hypothetical protein NC418_11570 [Muribaculaceae bacterium]|nr:hypothetical protein [Muribaculaceae bacterium]
MAELNIPTEIKDIKAFPQVDKTARQIITYAVLMSADNQSAFMRFHPEYLDASGKAMNSAGKQASRQFWGYGKVKDYREQYVQEVAEFLGRKQAIRSEASDIDDSRKDKALRSLLSQAMSLVEGGSDLDAETIKMCSDIFTKLGLIKSTEEQQIKPLRFLPLHCWGDGCRYRLFCESMVLEGSAIDECQFCKARAKAEELGYKFKDTELLNIPEDVVKRLEEKNNVKLEDIISGRVQN